MRWNFVGWTPLRYIWQPNRLGEVRAHRKAHSLGMTVARPVMCMYSSLQSRYIGKAWVNTSALSVN